MLYIGECSRVTQCFVYVVLKWQISINSPITLTSKTVSYWHNEGHHFTLGSENIVLMLINAVKFKWSDQHNELKQAPILIAGLKEPMESTC